MKNHRTSKIKRKRKSGFLARTSSSKGRKILNRRRSAGRSAGISK
ncbi:MAG: 50S ribosomal protein L34 [Sedimentisphaerales bacterium]|nr:50S ribosomal protein L34 [Sedimentisphaerales bacterium]